MSQPNWKFVLSTYTGTTVGELQNCSERSVTRSLSTASTASFKVPVTGAYTANLLADDDLNLRCYRAGSLIFHGPVTSVELAASDATQQPKIAVTAADPAWRWTKRLVAKNPTAVSTTGDRLTVAESLLTTVNSGGETGITMPTGETCGSATITYPAGPYKYADEVLRDLAQAGDGFDWKIEPIEYASGKIGEFDAAATLGSAKPNVVFEYQGRGNMRVPTYQRSLDQVANRAFHILDEGPAVVNGVRQDEDATSIAARGLYETIIEVQGLSDTTQRDTLIDDHLGIRSGWRKVFAFQPDFNDGSGRVPAYYDDYQVGDTVRARVLYDGTTLIDGQVRIYKVEFGIDESGLESITPTLVDES